VGVAALSASALTLTAPAHAGSYDVWSCRDGAGLPLAAEGWQMTTRGAAPGDVEVSDTCLSGGSLDLRGADQALANSVEGTLTFAAPRGTSISAYRLDRYITAAVAAPGYSHAFIVAVRERTATAERETGCASVLMLPDYNCSAEGDRADPAAAVNAVVRTGVALDGVQLQFRCVSRVCDRPLIGPGALLRLWRAQITLDDVSAPTAPELSGSLVAGAAVDASGTLVVDSSDVGGGISGMTLQVDGGPPQLIAPAGPGGTCALPYTTPQPCPTSAARVFTVDTAALSEGVHTLSGSVIDAAANVTTFGPVAFTVAHPTPTIPAPPPAPPVVVPPSPVGNGSPVVTTPLLRLDRATVIRAGTTAARVSGTLRTPAGVPIVGASLVVTASDLGTDAGRTRGGWTVVTDTAGRFSLPIEAPGAKASGAQLVEVAFSPAGSATATAWATAVVRADARLTAARSAARLRRGKAVVIDGRIAGVGAAGKGAIVELQAIVRGSWRTVGTVSAGADGRYSWRYRFVNTTRDTIFSFRALVRSSPGWPWPELHSRRLLVRVDAD
jgi:hypothetical protein